MMRRTLSGPVLARDLGGGVWQLTIGASHAAQVYLRMPAGSDCGALRSGGIQGLDIEWRNDGVAVRVTGDLGVAVFDAGTAIVHEPKSRLYDGLPLARFDAKARRFWNRVFLIIGIPGGRHVLRLIARRRRRDPG